MFSEIFSGFNQFSMQVHFHVYPLSRVVAGVQGQFAFALSPVKIKRLLLHTRFRKLEQYRLVDDTTLRVIVAKL